MLNVMLEYLFCQIEIFGGDVYWKLDEAYLPLRNCFKDALFRLETSFQLDFVSYDNKSFPLAGAAVPKVNFPASSIFSVNPNIFRGSRKSVPSKTLGCAFKVQESRAVSERVLLIYFLPKNIRFMQFQVNVCWESKWNVRGGKLFFCSQI